MKLGQVILFVGVAVVLTVVLMSLPKAVVVNKKTAARDQQPQSSDTTGQSQPSIHGHSPSADSRQVIDSLRRELANVDDKGTLLDQLCEAYQASFMYDSCAYLTEKVLGSEDVQGLGKTAERYFDAFQYSKDPAQGQALAQKAKNLLATSVDRAPEDLDNKVRLGITKALTESPPMQGIFMIKSVLEQEPKNKLALKYLGIFSIRSGQLDKAVERLEVLKNVDPQDFEARLMLGTALSELGRNEEAKQELMEIVNGTDRKDLVQSAQELLIKVEREIPVSSEEPNS